MNDKLEIERKFIIKMPNFAFLQTMADYKKSEIVQTYLISERGCTERVRKRAFGDAVSYYHTRKQRVDAMTCIEEEKEIDRAEYDRLLLRACPASRPIIKTRHTFSFGTHTVEIDKYLWWDRIAVLEVELPSCECELNLPDFLEVIFEATGDFSLSNASLAKHFPSEDDLIKNHL